MIPDKKGFLYPKVDATICNNCGICEKTCPFENRTVKLNIPLTAYAACNKDRERGIEEAHGEWFPWLYLLRKEAISNFKFNEHTKFQEDIDFYSRLFASHELRCGYLDERMYLYRKRTASITTTAQISNLRRFVFAMRCIL